MLTQSLYALRILLDVALIRATGASVVWTIHNRVSHESRWPGLEKWLQRSLAKRIDRVIIHSHASLEELHADLHLPDGKTSVIPHGHYRTVYGPPIDSAAARAALGLPESGRVFLYFGMLRPYKGVERLIEAWQTTETGSGNTLVIAGKSLERRVSLSLEDSRSRCESIQLRAGFVPNSDVPLYFSAADLVILPFASILTSGSLLLAMSYGKPVIAPGFAAIAETMGEAGDLLYDPDDAQGLQRSLERSTTLPLRPLQQRPSRHVIGWTGRQSRN